MTKHEASAPTCPTLTARWRRWLDPRLFRVGGGSGLLGGLCCIAGPSRLAAALAARGLPAD